MVQIRRFMSPSTKANKEWHTPSTKRSQTGSTALLTATHMYRPLKTSKKVSEPTQCTSLCLFSGSHTFVFLCLCFSFSPPFWVNAAVSAIACCTFLLATSLSLSLSFSHCLLLSSPIIFAEQVALIFAACCSFFWCRPRLEAYRATVLAYRTAQALVHGVHHGRWRLSSI